MVDFDVVVVQHLISDGSLPNQPSARKHILNPLDLDVHDLPPILVHQTVVQLKTTKYWLLVDFILTQV